jgi:hypothetical protein
MRKRTATLFMMLAALSSFGAVSGVAQARHGADDRSHHRRADDRSHHRRGAVRGHHHRHRAHDVNDDVSRADGPGHH